MGAFHLCAVAATFLGAFLAPALLGGPKPAWRPALAGQVAIALAISLAGLLAGAPASAWLGAAAFAAALAALAAGAHLLAGQLASGLLVCALGGSLFWGRPLVDEALSRGADPAARLQGLLAVNPYAVLSGSVLGRDLLHDPVLYGYHYADYVAGSSYPAALPHAAALVAAGAVLGAAGILLRRRRPA